MATFIKKLIIFFLLCVLSCIATLFVFEHLRYLVMPSDKVFYSKTKKELGLAWKLENRKSPDKDYWVKSETFFRQKRDGVWFSKDTIKATSVIVTDK